MSILALDTETEGLGYWDKPFMVSGAWRWNKPFKGGLAWRGGSDLCSSVWDAYPARPILLHNKTLVFHNAKFDVQKLVMAGWIETPDWTNIHDTECLSHLVNEQQPKALKKLAKDLLGLETDEAEVLRKERRRLKLKKVDGFDAIPREVLEPYARKDAEFTLLLFEYLWPIVEGDSELLRLYREEQELMGVLYDMEAKGLGVDVEYVDTTTKALASEILETDLSIRDMVNDEEFNSGSWQQVQAALKERGHDPPDTKKATLAALGDALADAILSLRHAVKQHGTYFKNIQLEVRSGILHPNFKQWGTRGRRFSSGGTEES